MTKTTDLSDSRTIDMGEVDHFGLYLLDAPDTELELWVMDGENSIRIGDGDNARRLAAALLTVAGPAKPNPADVDELAARRMARAAAEATDCGIAGCDRELHDPDEPLSEWKHRIWRDDSTGAQIEFVVDGAGNTEAELFVEKREVAVDSDRLRELAHAFQQQAHAALGAAELLEDRARRLRRRVDAVDALLDLEG